MTKGLERPRTGYRKTEDVVIIERRNFEGSATPGEADPTAGSTDEPEPPSNTAALLLHPAVLHDDAH